MKKEIEQINADSKRIRETRIELVSNLHYEDYEDDVMNASHFELRQEYRNRIDSTLGEEMAMEWADLQDMLLDAYSVALFEDRSVTWVFGKEENYAN